MTDENTTLLLKILWALVWVITLPVRLIFGVACLIIAVVCGIVWLVCSVIVFFLELYQQRKLSKKWGPAMAEAARRAKK